MSNSGNLAEEPLTFGHFQPPTCDCLACLGSHERITTLHLTLTMLHEHFEPGTVTP